MNEIQLKYGCNPNQKPSRIYMEDGSDLPVKVLNGKPGYINFLDAFNGWQLVKGTQGGNRTSSSNIIQACFTSRRCSWTSTYRYTCKDLLGR